MSFKSEKQRNYLTEKHPKVADKFVRDDKKKKKVKDHLTARY